MLPARLIRALDTLRINKTAKARMMSLRNANAELSSFNQGRSNNSFNASGISSDVIRKDWMLLSILPAALIRALDVFVVIKGI